MGYYQQTLIAPSRAQRVPGNRRTDDRSFQSYKASNSNESINAILAYFHRGEKIEKIKRFRCECQPRTDVGFRMEKHIAGGHSARTG